MPGRRSSSLGEPGAQGFEPGPTSARGAADVGLPVVRHQLLVPRMLSPLIEIQRRTAIHAPARHVRARSRSRCRTDPGTASGSARSADGGVAASGRPHPGYVVARLWMPTGGPPRGEAPGPDRDRGQGGQGRDSRSPRRHPPGDQGTGEERQQRSAEQDERQVDEDHAQIAGVASDPPSMLNAGRGAQRAGPVATPRPVNDRDLKTSGSPGQTLVRPCPGCSRRLGPARGCLQSDSRVPKRTFRGCSGQASPRSRRAMSMSSCNALTRSARVSPAVSSSAAACSSPATGSLSPCSWWPSSTWHPRHVQQGADAEGARGRLASRPASVPIRRRPLTPSVWAVVLREGVLPQVRFLAECPGEPCAVAVAQDGR